MTSPAVTAGQRHRERDALAVGSKAQFLGQVLPLDARMQHEQGPAQGLPVRHLLDDQRREPRKHHAHKLVGVSHTTSTMASPFVTTEYGTEPLV
ncbi:hypothetical protein SUDANB15_00144 [Streptomyces sp. enrichment culture]